MVSESGGRRTGNVVGREVVFLGDECVQFIEASDGGGGGGG